MADATGDLMNWRWTLVALVGLFLIVAFRYLLKGPKPQLASPVVINTLRVAGVELLGVNTGVPHFVLSPTFAGYAPFNRPCNAGDTIMVGYTNTNSVPVKFSTAWIIENSDGSRDCHALSGTCRARCSGAFSRCLQRGGVLLYVYAAAVQS